MFSGSESSSQSLKFFSSSSSEPASFFLSSFGSDSSLMILIFLDSGCALYTRVMSMFSLELATLAIYLTLTGPSYVVLL